MRILLYFIKLIIRFFSSLLGDYLLLRIYKKTPNFLMVNENKINEFSEVGIILQGPPVYKDDFTFNTVKLYKQKYPKVQIIVSLWDDVDDNFVKTVEALDVQVLISKKPIPGVNNINLQIKSTEVAISFLKESCDFVLKTRSDQRCDCDIDFISYFKNLQNLFPVQNKPLEKRLIISNLKMSPDRLYGITDFFMFGTTEDMELYWCIPFDSKSESDCILEKDKRFFIRSEVSEGYLVSRFCNNIDYKCKWTEQDSNRFLSKFFCVVNSNELGHFWYKYNWQNDNFLLEGNTIDFKEEISFATWLDYYLKDKYSSIQ